MFLLDLLVFVEDRLICQIFLISLKNLYVGEQRNISRRE